jgi:hypothetical protein
VSGYECSSTRFHAQPDAVSVLSVPDPLVADLLAALPADPVEADALLDARRLAYPALEQRGEAMLTEDVCLPRGRLAEMLAHVAATCTRCCSPRTATRPRSTARRPRSTTSSTPRSPSAAR